ncbi:MAG: hypothetical protein WBA89_08800 [Microcoleus sp.]
MKRAIALSTKPAQFSINRSRIDRDRCRSRAVFASKMLTEFSANSARCCSCLARFSRVGIQFPSASYQRRRSRSTPRYSPCHKPKPKSIWAIPFMRRLKPLLHAQSRQKPD